MRAAAWAPKIAAAALWAAAGYHASVAILSAKAPAAEPKAYPAAIDPAGADPAKMASAFSTGGAVQAPASSTRAAAANFTLAGLTAFEGGQGIALLRQGQKPAIPYRSGSELPGGGRLAEVFEGKAILEIDGQRVELEAPKKPRELPPLPPSQAGFPR